MSKKNIFSGVLAGILIIICLLAAFAFKKKGEKEQYDVVFFGDSIVASDYSGIWDIPTLVSEETGLTVLNAGFGGYTMSNRNIPAYPGDSGRLFCMIGLSDSVRIRDFSNQRMTTFNGQGATGYIPVVATHLYNTDWDSVKYILIEQGANDYLTGVPIDDGFDRYNEYTFGGALRKSIENIRVGVPNAQIILVTPIYMKPDGLLGDCNSKDFGGGLLKEYVAKELEIAAEYGIYVIDDFHEIDINKDNYEQYLPGGLHPNLEGNQLLAQNISRHLKELNENP